MDKSEPGRVVTLFLPEDCIEKLEAAADRDSREVDHMAAVAIRSWDRKLTRGRKGG